LVNIPILNSQHSQQKYIIGIIVWLAPFQCLAPSAVHSLQGDLFSGS